MTESVPFVVFGDQWGLHPTSVQHLVVRLSRTNPLLYVNTFLPRRLRWTADDARRAWSKLRLWTSREPNSSPETLPSVRFHSPVLIPFSPAGLIRRWNRRALLQGLRRELKTHDLKAPVLFVTLPIGAEVAGELGERLLVYYVTDEYAALPGVYSDYIEDLERTLLSQADLIFVTSQALLGRKNGKKTPATFLPHGVDYEHFHSAAEPLGPIPEELRRMPRPILGFHGLLAPWVDVGLLEHLCRAFPQGSIVLIGPKWVEFPVPRGTRNLYCLGPLPYRDLPRYSAHFDVGLVPFRQDRLTAYTNPLKVLEYLALGLPVVTTPLPDVAGFSDVVYCAKAPDEFVDQVRLALHDNGAERRQERFGRAAAQSWEARVGTIQQSVGGALRQRSIL